EEGVEAWGVVVRVVSPIEGDTGGPALGGVVAVVEDEVMVKGEVVGVGSHDTGSPKIVGVDVRDADMVGLVNVDGIAGVLAVHREVLEGDILGLGADVDEVVRHLASDDGFTIDVTGEGDVSGGGAGVGVEGGGAL